MRTDRHTLAFAGPTLLGALSLLLAPGNCTAEHLVVRNESQGPLVITVVGVVGKMLRRERPILLNPRDVSPAMAVPGNKILIVYDGKVPNRVLYQGAIPASPMDQFIAVVPDIRPPKMRIERRQSFRGR